MATVAIAVLATCYIARGAEYHWDGGSTNIATPGNANSAGGDGTWSTAIANWDPDITASAHVAWPDGNSATFGGVTGSNSTVTLGSNVSVANQSSPSLRAMTFDQNYTINGDANNTYSINLSTSSSTIGVNSNLLVTINANFAVGSGTLTKSLIGTLVLTGNNGGLAGVNMSAGTLQVGSSNAVGSGLLRFLDTSTFTSSSATPRSFSNPIGTFAGTNAVYTFGSPGTGALTFTNTATAPLVAGSGAAVNRVFSTVVATSFANGFSNSTSTTPSIASIEKQGAASLILNGNSTYSGGTTITAGTLVANNAVSATGSGGVAVNNGGTLAGGSSTTVGRINNTGGAVSVNLGGTITAGSGATVTDSVGTLKTVGTQTWNGAGTAGGTSRGRFVWKYAGNDSTAGTNWDLLQMGTLNIVASSGSKFGITARTINGSTFADQAGQSFLLAQGSVLQINGVSAAMGTNIDITDLFYLSLTGLGGDIVDNDSRFQVSYSFNGSSFSVSMSESAPEPGTAALFVMAGMPLLMRRRQSEQTPSES